MELPLEYKNKLESLLDGYSLKTLKECAFLISDNYQKGINNHISDELSSKVYAVMRYPATFKAFSKALESSLKHFDGDIKTLIDVGAGSGAATLASFLSLNIDKATLLEKESSMIKVGEYLLKTLNLIERLNITKLILQKHRLR